MLKTISPTKSVPVQNPYFFNIMVKKTNLIFQHLARQSYSMDPRLIVASHAPVSRARNFVRTRENLFLQPGMFFSFLRTCRLSLSRIKASTMDPNPKL